MFDKDTSKILNHGHHKSKSHGRQRFYCQLPPIKTQGTSCAPHVFHSCRMQFWSAVRFRNWSSFQNSFESAYMKAHETN